MTGPAGVPVAHATLFSESAGRVILGVEPRHLAAVLDRAAAAGVVATVIGTTGGGALTIKVDGDAALDDGRGRTARGVGTRPRGRVGVAARADEAGWLDGPTY